MKRTNKHLGIKLWSILSGSILIFLVLYMNIYIFSKGKEGLSIDFLMDMPKGFPLGTDGGIFPAIIGSIYFTSIACFFAGMIAIATAIYLNFYCTNKRIYGGIHMVIQSTAGIPSIVLGLFGYTFLVVHLNFGISLLSGGMVLGIMIFPFIEVKVEKAFQEISKELIYASYALGISKAYTFFKIILPICFGEIISAIALAGGFAMGAVAPIIFTGGVLYAPEPKGIFSPAMALPYHLYILIGEGISIENAYKTAAVLLVLLLVLNSFSIFIGLFRKVE
ncbi:PstA family ABC transporter permease [Marinisporobacter balticus]|uniref:Phosphate ABC transporter membrane protein 2 (PhoT family) n=1 Tax=Marinisporobacter balticus TaxID=2018667 RepID=A0A4R2L105_9FIRM|nr:ABC transporter permease subunit [Marinisporobacter balticus]TCO72685.1 phosphate ABC transporter membrane protein 2 (PhoT family) [Marinisporobacter balticus]